MTATKQEEAQYRVTLKRALRAAGLDVWETDTKHYEQTIRKLAHDAPGIVSSAADYWFKRAARAWGEGNNSGDNATMEQRDADCDRYRDGSARMLALLGIACDYPGLYPTFAVDGHTYYDALAAVKAATAK